METRLFDSWKIVALVAVLALVFLGPVSVQNKSNFLVINSAHAQATTGAGSSGTAPTQAAAQTGQSTTLNSCAGLSGFKPSCWFDVIATASAALIISIAVTILEVIGWLFNLSISYTVLGFNGLITGGVLTAISTGWTFFRDIANIILIGLFVFIAISIILGINSYGQKSLIARVLIVAVLLNFSFLFTRIVINFSNALATQFAKIQPLSAEVTSLGVKPPDIAGKYTELMGIKSLSKTKDTLQKISAANNSTLYSLMHALMVVVVVFGVAIVLLYGALLLIVRAVVLIFLLVTSSLAFATYLYPTLAASEFGWKAWWIALFRNALLAPVMMLFLAVTLQIGNGLVAAIDPTNQNSTANGGVGVLGALASNPNDPKNVSALMIYILILGLLYGAIRISNKFSGAAGQMAWSGTLPFANATVAWPSRSLGFLGRNTLGRGALAASKTFEARAQRAPKGGMREWSWDRLAVGAKKVAGQSFNPMKNPKADKSFIAQQERRQKDIVGAAKRTTPSNDVVKAERDKVRAEATKQVTADRSTIEAQKNSAQQMQRAAEDMAKTATQSKNAIEKEISGMEATLKNMNPTVRASEEGRQLERDISNKKGEMKQRTDDISRASDAAQRHSDEVMRLTEVGKRFDDTLQRRIDDKIDELVPSDKFKHSEIAKTDKEGNVVVKSGEVQLKSKDERVADVAVAQALNRMSNTLNRVAGVTKEQGDKFSQEVRKMATKITKEDNEKKSILHKILHEEKKQTETAQDIKHEVKAGNNHDH